jgi:hypothetical protein
MTRFTPIIVKIFLLTIIYSFISCTSELQISEDNTNMKQIATAIDVQQVKASGNEDISRCETKAPEMKIIKVKGAKGDMFMRFTAAAGISGKEYLESDNSSRGKMITIDNFYDDYGLFTYKYPQSQTWATASATAQPIVVNEQVKKGLSWLTKEFWPGAGSKLAFYGYAPYNAVGVSALPTASTIGKPKFHYVTPAEATDQKDLLVSEDDEYVTTLNEDGGVDVPGNYNAIKTLKFKHACTAVRIAVGDQMAPCTITKIAIKGVYGEADYNYGAGTNPNEGNWENYSSTLSDYTLTADFIVSATDQNKVINTGKYTFMLLPQTVPDDAVIEITINDGEEHVLSADIGGSIWQMGYSVTYFLSTSSVNESTVLLVSPSDTQMSSAGGSNTLNIQSYRQTFYGSQVAIPWTLSYSYEEENLGNSGWLSNTNNIITSATFSGNGGSAGENNVIQVARQVERSKTWRSTHTATLRAAAEQGTASSPVDLSAGKRTANCYVVSASGYYTFPLVYGNARNADGSANTNSYGTSTFVDHNGVQINSPYIYETNNGANVPNDAFIVWQDAPHLVNPSSVKLSADKHNIEFQIEKKNICQGNSVIAVCDANGTIMWSWHIWVTDHDMNNTIEVHNNASVGGSVISYFMEVPLGWCDAEIRVRDKHTLKFKVMQSEAGGLTSTTTIEQLSADSLYEYGNNATYYQWGRKDPMLPSDGTGSVDKPFYDNQRVWQKISGYQATATAIQNPFTFYYKNNDDWSSSHSYQYWNKNYTAAASVSNTATLKTIYSPSPSGFVEPKTAAFTGFTSTGANTTNSSQFNVNSTWNDGWSFYTNGWKTGSTIFFNAFGYRSTYNNGTGVISSFYGGGEFWACGAASVSLGRNLYFLSNRVDPQNRGGRSYGNSVWSVKE